MGNKSALVRDRTSSPVTEVTKKRKRPALMAHPSTTLILYAKMFY